MDTAKENEIIKDIRAMGKFGVFVGRINPMHLGHQVQIDLLIKAFEKQHLVMLGSCNKPISIRHLFQHEDRSEFVHAVHPAARIVPLPDFDDNQSWFTALDHLIQASGGDPKETVFFGGCEEDVLFYNGTGRKVYIVNRFEGMTKNVSGTEIRDALIEKRSLEGLLDPQIIPLVQERFAVRWDQVRQK